MAIFYEVFFCFDKLLRLSLHAVYHVGVNEMEGMEGQTRGAGESGGNRKRGGKNKQKGKKREEKKMEENSTFKGTVTQKYKFEHHLLISV